MIRINLLGVTKPVARAAGPSEGMAPEAIIIPGVLLVVLGLVAGFVWWYWSSQIDALNKRYVAAQREQARLAGIMEQNKVYEARLNQLQQRINTIQTLQSSRTGPVELMHVLGLLANRSNDLYLLTVTTTGGRLVLTGQANSPDAIANFIGALQRSDTFDDVQLRQSVEDDKDKRVSFKFNLDCVFKQTAPETATAPGAQPVTPPAPAPKRAGL
ncbi:MAG TPA: PilN domain-containing protein [Terriglobia bacterium]|nr:PilN domain-containing protein [Terriglobia bacterium]